MGETVKLTSSSTGGPAFVYVKDGKIVRVTPMDFDETDGPSWKIEARGRTFTPPRKTTFQFYTAGYKSLVYSPDRILSPMKRVDFDHKGERNIQNRGTSLLPTFGSLKASMIKNIMGKPGSNIWSTMMGAPVDHDFFPGYAEGGISGDTENSAAGYMFAWLMFDGIKIEGESLNLGFIEI